MNPCTSYFIEGTSKKYFNCQNDDKVTSPVCTFQIADNARDWARERSDLQFRLQEAEHGLNQPPQPSYNTYPKIVSLGKQVKCKYKCHVSKIVIILRLSWAYNYNLEWLVVPHYLQVKRPSPEPLPPRRYSRAPAPVNASNRRHKVDRGQSNRPMNFRDWMKLSVHMFNKLFWIKRCWCGI